MPSDAASLLHALLERTGTPTPGRPGLVVAPPGTGKTALLAHVAIEALLAERRVLHVALGDTVEHVRAHYDEVLRAVRGLSGSDHATATIAIERRRMILSYAHPSAGSAFSPPHLLERVRMLGEVAGFQPERIVLDGVRADAWAAHGEALAGLSAELGVELWIGVSTEDGLPVGGPETAFVLRLALEEGAMHLHLVADGADAALPWSLDPSTLGLVDGTQVEGPAVPASSVTLYSGGAAGAEEAFGAAAERYGLREVAFTFEGHRQAREVGRVELSSRELEAGDVSLVYVSRRLSREYNQHGLIRKVLQTLWHMVSRAQQVFVVGVIQPDRTVVGGTGWSVELARMWSKEVWVYDQDRHAWFTWDGSAWARGEPRITSAQICGTGTRYLEDDGRAAIDGLFERSFR
jgi:hypothetical protein